MNRRLWYRSPAEQWIEALPIGNGRLGAMLFGGVETEIAALNEDTLWSGRPDDHNEPGRAVYFQQAQALALQDDYAGAQAVLEENFTGEFVESYQPLGTLRLSFAHAAAERYERALDLETAVHRVSFWDGDTRFDRESFASVPDQCIVMRLTREGPKSLAFSARLDSPLAHTLSCAADGLHLEGQCPSHVEPEYVESARPVVYDPAAPGIRFHAVVGADTDGTLTYGADGLTVADASWATLVFAARSNFKDWKTDPAQAGVPYRETACLDAARALQRPYAALRDRHTADYRALFDRVSLTLGTGRDDLPTDERLIAYQDDKDDPGLAALLFDYGRYLLIASSREGTQAANLQGIWNEKVRPPWSCNFTTNINVQMNYWPALVCGLEALTEPLHRLVQGLSEAGQRTARAYYDAAGFAVHHNVDIWLHCNPVGRRRATGACHDFWPMAGGWLTGHLYAYYAYTGDRTFLRDVAYPCLREASRFFLDLMTEDGTGHRAIVPATSPENQFLWEGKIQGVSRTATMTDAIVRETLTQTLESARTLGLDPDWQETLAQAIDALPPYRIGPDGRLLEWNAAFEESEPAHRHVSHLFGLYPARQITMEDTPALAEACRKSLLRRTDEGTGWSLGWKLCLWARLHDGDHALHLLEQQLRLTRADSIDVRHQGGGTYPNLFDAHPPFQIDGNFGACAGIAEMLLQSDAHAVTLLPALPGAWRTGTVDGLRAAGGLRVSIDWADGRLTRAVLTADHDCVIEVRYGALRRRAALQARVPLIWKEEAPCSKESPMCCRRPC